MVLNSMTVCRVLHKLRVHYDFVTQYFSRFQSGYASQGKKQHPWVIVLGMKLAGFVFSLICSYFCQMILSSFKEIPE